MNETAEVALKNKSKNKKVHEYPDGTRFAYLDIDITGYDWCHELAEFDVRFRNSRAMKSDMVITVCYNDSDNNIGYSVCSMNDQFQKRLGRKKAYGKLVQALEHGIKTNGPDVILDYQIVGLNKIVEDFINANLG